MRVLVFGGGGYCGGVLVPDLLKDNHKVTVFDTFWFGAKHLPISENLTLVNADVRDEAAIEAATRDQDVVLHLACISNDSSFALNEKLSTTVNYDSFGPLVKLCKKAGVKRFIFASSSSVYGVSDSPDVKEDHPLVPLTLYNKYKGLCEPILLDQIDGKFSAVVFRPATVCGFSPRLRLDLSVNILTHHAFNNGKITVFGGEQLRPNLHIQDYSDLCKTLIDIETSKIDGEIFNCGFQNMKIIEIADLVKEVVETEFNRANIELEVTSSDDNRSYHINSDKITQKIGFQPKRSVRDAVVDLCTAFAAGRVPNPDDNQYYNVKTMLDLGVI